MTNAALAFACFVVAASCMRPAWANPYFQPTARGPSYSCAAPRLTRVERLVCHDPTLSKLDLQLEAVAAHVLLASTDALRSNGDETRWLAGVRDACDGVACLTRAYRARIARLEAESGRRDPWAVEHAPRHIALDPALQRRLAVLVPEQCLEPSSVEALDLGDGRRSILETDCGHGNHNVQKYLFRLENAHYRLVFSDASANGFGSVTLQRARTHGLYRLRSTGGMGASENAIYFYDFDGSSYHPVACGDQQYFTNALERFVISACVSGTN